MPLISKRRPSRVDVKASFTLIISPVVGALVHNAGSVAVMFLSISPLFNLKARTYVLFGNSEAGFAVK